MIKIMQPEVHKSLPGKLAHWLESRAGVPYHIIVEYTQVT
jgi:hypothetical protein